MRAAGTLRLPRCLETLLAACLLLTAAPHGAAGQSVRGWVTSTVRYAELRPLRADTVPLGEAIAGRSAQCVPDVGCIGWVPAPVEHATTATQDVAITGWGFGVQGLSVTVLARGRARLGGGLVWPRSEDRFDLLSGYAQLNRGPVRVRLGRQESRSGLGFAAFDGADVLAVLPLGVRLQAYGGRSLARGLREPRDEALRGLQDFLPDRGAYLMGGALAHQAGPTTSAELRYQREIWSDRRGLISDRGSLDVRSTRLAPVTVSGAVDYDVGMGRVGKANLQVRLPLAAWDAAVEMTARRYLPYFELYTIWGFFSPVAYHEIEMRGSWEAGAVGLWATGAYRSYQDTGTGGFLVAPASRGWRLGGGGLWSPAPEVSVQGQYLVELVPGAFLSSADVSLRLRFNPRATLTATGTGFQQIEEFRIGDGRTLGVSLGADVLLSERVHLDAGAGAYRVVDGNASSAFDWSQLRGWSTLRVEVGNDPGLRARGGVR